MIYWILIKKWPWAIHYDLSFVLYFHLTLFISQLTNAFSNQWKKKVKDCVWWQGVIPVSLNIINQQWTQTVWCYMVDGRNCCVNKARLWRDCTNKQHAFWTAPEPHAARILCWFYFVLFSGVDVRHYQKPTIKKKKKKGLLSRAECCCAVESQ